MPKMNLRQPGFTYSACTPFTKNKERKKVLKNRRFTVYLSKRIRYFMFSKACFQHDMAYGDFKDLTRKATSDKILRDKAFNIARNPKCDGYQISLASVVYKSF